MKKILVIAAASMVASSVCAQGLLNWSTGGGTGSTIKYGADPMFGASAGLTYNGSYPGSSPLTAGIWVGPAGTAAGNLVYVPTSAKVVGTAGPSMGNVTGMAAFAVPNYAGGTTISLQIRAWSGASWEVRSPVAGASGVTQIVLGGPSPNPSVPAWNLVGVAPVTTWGGIAPTGSGPLAGFALTVPEPASASLMGLGLASLLIFRRRK